MAKAVVLVLDSFGIGSSADASRFGDDGANTFLHIAQACAKGECEKLRSGRLHLPNMQRLGLALACFESCSIYPPMLTDAQQIAGAYGFATSVSTAKDTTSGHWELMGLPITKHWSYPDFSKTEYQRDFLPWFKKAAGLEGTLANCASSGTQVIQDFGEQHLKTGFPILYTSADSVLQIACHESRFSTPQLYRLCEIARNILNEFNVARVIARPFTGDPENGFFRTDGRRDYSVKPTAPTLLNQLQFNDIEVVGVGKISDIFADSGISKSVSAYGLQELVSATKSAIVGAEQDSLIFTNLVDFDTQFGHRRDVSGYARELEAFDCMLPTIMQLLGPDDLLILTADHGCDPTWYGTDHTREHIPILLYQHNIRPGFIGARHSFADVGQTLAEFFYLGPLEHGASFYQSLQNQEVPHDNTTY